MDDAAVLAHGIERVRPLAVPDQIRIAIIFEDRNAELRGEAEHFAATRFAQDRSSRILHGRHRVDVFRPHAAALEIIERGGERVHAHALAIQRNADGGDAKTLQSRQRALIGRLLDDHGVTAREQYSVHQIERLQRAGGDEDFVGVAANAGGAFEFAGQKFAQATIAERTAGKPVSRQRAALARQHVVRRFDQRLERHLVGIVVAADEIVFGRAGPFGDRRRQAGREQRREIQYGHGHFSLCPGH